MNTRILMSASAVFLGVVGLGASFLPQEILGYCGVRPEELLVLIVQVAGALYLGFAVLNWAARGNLLGGIYSRPVALGNFLHFTVVALALVKAFLAGQREFVVIVGTVLYVLFAAAFGKVLFSPPSAQ